jgi:hypothetical protein
MASMTGTYQYYGTQLIMNVYEESTNIAGNYTTLRVQVYMYQPNNSTPWALDAVSSFSAGLGNGASWGYSYGYDHRSGNGDSTYLVNESYNYGHSSTSAASASFSASSSAAVIGSASTGTGYASMSATVIPPSAPGVPTIGARNSAGTSMSVTSAVASSSQTVTDYNYRWSTDNSTWSTDLAMGTGRVSTFGPSSPITVSKSQTYYFQTRAYADSVWGAYGSSSSSTGFPSVPRTLTATASTSVSNRITLNWTAPSTTNGSITGYDIYEYNTGTGVSRLVKQVSGSTLTYLTTDSPLITFNVGTTYTFYVRARNAASDAVSGQSDNSNTAAVMSPGVPGAPTSLTATPVTTYPRVILNWTAPAVTSGGLTGYTILYKPAGGTYSQLATVSGTTTTYNADFLQSGVDFTFKVQARNAFADANTTTSADSNEASALAPGTATKPLSLTATPSTSVYGRIALNWSEPSDTAGGITGYNIFTVSGSTYTEIGSTTGTGTTFTANSLTSSQSYNFAVKARNLYSDSTGTLSEASDPVTAIAPGPPSAPRNLDAVADIDTAGVITLTWDAPTDVAGGLTGYNVFFSNGTLITSLDATTVTFDASGLTGGTTYYFYVRARNAISDVVNSSLGGAQSNTSYASAVGAPEMPPSFAISASTTIAGRVTLSWGAATDAMSYRIYTGAGVYVGRTGLTGLSYVIDGLVGNTTYSYKVQGVNLITPDGGPFTAAISVTPTNASTISVNSIAIANSTNDAIDGNVTITTIPTADSFRYSKTTANFATASVPSTFGTLVNTTNQSFNGTYTITTVGPTTTAFTFANTGIDVTYVAATGALYDNTNQLFNGTGLIVTGTNNTTGRLTYDRVGVTDISERTVSGTATNTSNTTFNGTDITITAVTPNTFSYARVGASDLDDTASSGSVTNNTNLAIFNGTQKITLTSEYNTLTYSPQPNAEYLPATALVNLITNSSFETNLTGWTAEAGTTATRVTTEHYVGGASMRLVGGGSTGASTAMITVAPDTYHTVSAWVKGTAGENAYIKATEYNSSDVLIVANTKTGVQGTDWTKLTTTFKTSPTAAKIKVNVGTTETSTTMYVDTISLANSAGYVVAAEIPTLYSTLKRAISKAVLKVIYRPGWIG